MLEITTRTKPSKILKYFKECGNGIVNLKTSWGFIYLVGGILNKLQGTDNDHYHAINGFWVKV